MLSARNIQDRKINFDDYRLIPDEGFAIEHARTAIDRSSRPDVALITV